MCMIREGGLEWCAELRATGEVFQNLRLRAAPISKATHDSLISAPMQGLLRFYILRLSFLVCASVLPPLHWECDGVVFQIGSLFSAC